MAGHDCFHRLFTALLTAMNVLYTQRRRYEVLIEEARDIGSLYQRCCVEKTFGWAEASVLHVLRLTEFTLRLEDVG